jgi:hypothetical protein
LAIESAENEITFRNIDVSQFQEVIAVVNIEKQEEAVLEANTVGSMVRFTFYCRYICFFSGVRDNWNFVSVCIFN